MQLRLSEQDSECLFINQCLFTSAYFSFACCTSRLKNANAFLNIVSLQNALTDLTAAQVEMHRLRRAEYTSFVAAKADLEQGLAGVKSSLLILTKQ